MNGTPNVRLNIWGVFLIIVNGKENSKFVVHKQPLI